MVSSSHLQVHAVHSKVGGISVVSIHEPVDINSAGMVLVAMLGQQHEMIA